MSSHREAPGISKDPVADSTDTYAFVSPDRPDSVTFITNYIPLEDTAGGPNFFEFGDDVRYEIHIDNDADGEADISYYFQFTTTVTNPNTFLYNTGPIDSLTSASWNRRQTYSLTKVVRTPSGAVQEVLGTELACPPCNIGPRSTPHYEQLAKDSISDLAGGVRSFAGQRAEGFYVDLGSIFDLGTLRPFQHLHLIPSAAAAGVNNAKNLAVHSIALQVPKTDLTADGSDPTDPAAAGSVIGMWAAASRQKAVLRQDETGVSEAAGPWVQVSRLGNPLFNEVIVPMPLKDEWNARKPHNDKKYTPYVRHPELAGLLPVLYPGVFPNLAALTAAREDLVAILLTGIPSGIIGGFQNYTGPTKADMLRLNMAIPPAENPKNLGLLKGDLAGFPNGRRPADDVVSIELRAVAGLTYPLVEPSYTPDGAASAITDGLTASSVGSQFLKRFPYLGSPISGYDVAVA